MLKPELSFIFRGIWLASSASTDRCLRKGGCFLYPEVAQRVNAWWQYSSESNYVGSSPVLFEKPNGKVTGAVCEWKHKRV